MKPGKFMPNPSRTALAFRPNFPEQGKFLAAKRFLFGPCTARFSLQDKEKWGVHSPHRNTAQTELPARKGSPPAAKTSPCQQQFSPLPQLYSASYCPSGQTKPGAATPVAAPAAYSARNLLHSEPFDDVAWPMKTGFSWEPGPISMGRNESAPCQGFAEQNAWTR